MGTHICGTLKLEKFASKRGDPVRVVHAEGECTTMWNNYAQEHRLESYWKRHAQWVRVEIRATSFIEGKTEFKVPGGFIQGIGIKKDVELNGKITNPKGSVNIVTRGHRSPFEKKIHSRWPVVKGENGKTHVFTIEDVISGPAQSTLL